MNNQRLKMYQRIFKGAIMSWKCQIYALVALAVIPSALLGADSQTPAAEPPSEDGIYQPVFTDGTARADHEPMFLTRGQSPGGQDLAVRFGWWGIDHSGSNTKIGEWQSLNSSAFFDADGLLSDGYTTTDFHATGTDDESTDLGLRVYRQGLSFDMEFDRFLHRLDHKSLANFTGTNIDGDHYTYADDLDVGSENAIRVQKFDAKFKGALTDNIKWGLNLWGMRKSGERGVMAFCHARDAGCGSSNCHVQSQSQQIDWLTMEIQPVIEAKFGAVTVEYSRTMRSFNQNDGIASRQYGASRHGRALRPNSPAAPDGDGLPFDYPYAVTSENFTQIDRLKFGVDLTENTQFYANLFLGDTENRNVNTHRDFDGFDLRVTNQSLKGLKLTAYSKRYTERNQLPSEQMRRDILGLDNADFSGTTLDANWPPAYAIYGDDPTEADLVAAFASPVDRTRVTAGTKARWKPFNSLSGFALTGGYEYRSIERTHAIYELDEASAGDPLFGLGPFAQQSTESNIFHVGTTFDVTRTVDSFIRYKMIQTDNPLLGFAKAQEADTWGQALNTNQPEHEDLIEFGGTWMPRQNFLLSATFGIQKRHNSSPEANFDEDDYPIVLSAWYAPTARWSISGGLAFLSNWIDQDITHGKGHGGSDTPNELAFEYGGRSEVINVGSSFAYTERLTLSGGLDFVRSSNAFGDPSVPAISLAALSGASDVLVETTRLNAGFDYELREGVNTYFQYSYYNYDDKAGNGNSGTANMFLGGLSATY